MKLFFPQCRRYLLQLKCWRGALHKQARTRDCGTQGVLTIYLRRQLSRCQCHFCGHRRKFYKVYLFWNQLLVYRYRMDTFLDSSSTPSSCWQQSSLLQHSSSSSCSAQHSVSFSHALASWEHFFFFCSFALLSVMADFTEIINLYRKSIIHLYLDDNSCSLCSIVPDLHHQSARCHSPEQTQSLPRDDDGLGRSQPPCGRGASRRSGPNPRSSQLLLPSKNMISNLQRYCEILTYLACFLNLDLQLIWVELNS